jgi:hypothetical protein
MGALGMNPDTGEILDVRDLPRTIQALVDGVHPEVRSVQRLGELRLVTRSIAVVDPILHLHKSALVRHVPSGKHEVTLLLGDDPTVVGAAVVRFAEGKVATVERAVATWPFACDRAFSLASGLAGVVDYNGVNRLDPDRRAELSALAQLAPGSIGAIVSLPRLRRWSMMVCRPAPDGDGFYSSHWALDACDAPLALVVDFAVFG